MCSSCKTWCQNCSCCKGIYKDSFNHIIHFVCVFQVGDDIWGEKYLDHLKQEKINNTNVLKTPGITNGIAQITVANSGENQIVIVAGANSYLKESDVYSENVKNLVATAKVVISQLETSADVALAAFSLSSNVSGLLFCY